MMKFIKVFPAPSGSLLSAEGKLDFRKKNAVWGKWEICLRDHDKNLFGAMGKNELIQFFDSKMFFPSNLNT